MATSRLRLVSNAKVGNAETALPQYAYYLVPMDLEPGFERATGVCVGHEAGLVLGSVLGAVRRGMGPVHTTKCDRGC